MGSAVARHESCSNFKIRRRPQIALEAPGISECSISGLFFDAGAAFLRRMDAPERLF
jgi:hypothetical protein